MADQSIGRLEGLLEGLDKTVDTLHKSLFGNGQPGVLTRQIRLEEQLEQLNEIMIENKNATIEAIQELRQFIEEQKKIVLQQSELIQEQTRLITQVNTKLNEHIGDENKRLLVFIKNTIFNKSTLTYLTLIAIIAHSVIEALGIGLVELKDWILKLVGIS